MTQSLRDAYLKIFKARVIRCPCEGRVKDIKTLGDFRKALVFIALKEVQSKMAKAKTSKGESANIPNKHLHARLSFLHQAATYLAVAGNVKASEPQTKSTSNEARNGSEYQTADPSTLCEKANNHHGLEAMRLLSQLRGVSRKTQIRLAPTMKHTLCKRCDSLLVPGKTSTERVVNESKDGRKPWADVLEIECVKCGTIKRFPVGMSRDKERRSTSPGKTSGITQ